MTESEQSGERWTAREITTAALAVIMMLGAIAMLIWCPQVSQAVPGTMMGAIIGYYFKTREQGDVADQIAQVREVLAAVRGGGGNADQNV